MFDGKMLKENIKKFRKINNMSQSDIAKILNVSSQSVSKWEKGHAVPAIEYVCAMADMFGISLDAFLGKNQTKEKIMIGIDGGGTKTEFLLFNEKGIILHRCVLGGSNPNAIGVENTVKVLKEGIDTMLKINPFVFGIYIGASGFLSVQNADSVRDMLNVFYPDIKIKCRVDITNVIASCGDYENCIAAICGTGSVVFVKNKEELTRLTGWGYLLGKNGSGYDIGRDAIYYSLMDSEELGEKTCICELVEKKAKMPVSEIIAEVYKHDQSYIASFAPCVFEAYIKGDSIAEKILRDNAMAIANVINKAYFKNKNIEQIVISGGLITGNEVYFKLIKEYLCSHIHIHIPEYPQVYGACVLCAKMCGVDTKQLDKNFKKYYI